jgi:hypothetical protein
MSYCISSGESFNMVLNYIDHSDPSTWKAGKEVEEMRAVYEGWDPRYANFPPLDVDFLSADKIPESQKY